MISDEVKAIDLSKLETWNGKNNKYS